MQKISLKLCNAKGLHARAAAKFSTTAADYHCQVKVSYNGQTVDGSSVIQLMLLAASCGKTIGLEISGTDEILAIEALTQLIRKGFDEN